MATIKLYINTDRGDISRAFVKSTSEPTTESNVPALVAGNKRNVEVYLIDSAGNYDARSGASNYALSIGAGPLAGTPSSGTFTLTDGTETTTALAHNASAQVVEDALNALNSNTGPFGQLVDVTSAYDGNYLVKFRTTGAVAALAGDASELSPQSAVVVDEARAGDGSTKEQQFIRLLRQPAIFQDSFTQIANGWSGELSANNARVLELMAGRDTIAIPLDVELTETGNEPETIARGNMLLSNEVMNPASIDPGNLAQLLTEALGDARYLRTTNNFSDVTNAATARSNIEAAAAADLTAHTGSTSNPHSVTAAQVGLGNVDNTSDADKPVSTAQQTALDLKADATALTTETNARIDADNRREFAGGVYLDESSIELPLNINLGNKTFTIVSNFGANYDSTNNGLFSKGASTAGVIELRQDGSNSLRFIWRKNLNNYHWTFPFSSDNTFRLVQITFDPENDSEPTVYINGSAVTVSSVVGSYSYDSSYNDASYNVYIGARNLNVDKFIGNISNFAIFNTALTATQAAELYQQGLQPWLAANPEYRRGGISFNYNDLQSGWVDGLSGSLITSSTTFTTDGTNNGRITYNYAWEIGKKYYVTLLGSVTSGQLEIQNAQTGSVLASGFGTFEITAPSTTFRIVNDSASTNTITEISFIVIGSLATLPLDDDCRQLKDISGNRNDATASESGVTHLKQKNLHAFRDDNADGTGGSYLIANADILAENEVITGVTVDGRFYAASGDQDLTKRRIKLQDHGSHVDVKRSNGTTDDSAIAVTNPSDGTDFAITVLTQRI